MGRILPVIWSTDQSRGLRRIGTTGKSRAVTEIVSSDRQLLFSVIPGRAIARTRNPWRSTNDWKIGFRAQPCGLPRNDS